MNLLKSTLRRYRAANDLSFLGLAKEIRITSQMLVDYESGRRTPSLANLQRIAKFFAWSRTDLGDYVLSCRPARVGPKRFRETMA